MTNKQSAMNRHVVLVTGLSGAGKSSVLNALEDLGYEAIDNLPLRLWPYAVAYESSETKAKGLVIGLDVRTRGFDVNKFLEILDVMRATIGLQVSLIFLDCDDDALQRRFTETRRRHPLAPDRAVFDGITQERKQLSLLRNSADLLLDTTTLSLPELRNTVRERIAINPHDTLAVHVLSFAYKNGLPRSADLVLDMRFLRNPHYDPLLRTKTGRDQEVADYISQDPDFEQVNQELEAFLSTSLRRYEKEGKSYLTIAFGCSGGKHRSVYFALRTGHWIKKLGMQVTVRHRELDIFESP